MGNALIINQKEKIRELIDSAESIGIVIGENQNIDSVAASLGLYLVLTAHGKNVQVVSKKEPIVELANIFGIDRISSTFAGKTSALTISVPYKEGEIEKVSYNIEDDRLNVNLFAENSGITFDEREIEYIKKGSSPTLLILIGVSNESELTSLADLKSAKSIVIDKNPLNAITGDVSIVDPSFSSMSEIITGIIIDLGLPFDIDAFQNLMDGIIYATRNFTSQSTSPFAFEAAGFLMRNGVARASRSQEKRRDDRFPKEDYFLNQRPNNPIQNMQNPAKLVPPAKVPSWQPSRDVQSGGVDDSQNTTPQTFPGNQQKQEQEEKIPEDVPEDWFLPKVFKGSRKGN